MINQNMLKKLLVSTTALMALSLIVKDKVSAAERLVLTGSSTVAPLAVELGKAFEKRNKGVRVDVQTGGSTRGIIDAKRGLNDIGMISRDLKEKEKDLYSFTIAKDGIAIIVHKRNSTKELSRRQIIKIYKKEITNWKELGGTNAPIVVVNKAEGRSTLELFLKFFKIKNSKIKADIIIGDNEQGIKTIAGNPNAIGYVSIGAGEFNRELGVPVKLLPLDGVIASTENLENNTYPLARNLNFVVARKPEGVAKKFLEFSRNKNVHKIISQQSFVPIKY